MENRIVKDDNITQVKVGKQHHLWYEGDVIKLRHNDTDVFISALGTVDLSLIDKIGGNEVFQINDGFNKGMFFDELSKLVKNDEELDLILNDKHPRYELKNNKQNYWECYFAYKGEKHDLKWKLGASTITKAIVEVHKELTGRYNAFKLNQLWANGLSKKY